MDVGLPRASHEARPAFSSRLEADLVEAPAQSAPDVTHHPFRAHMYSIILWEKLQYQRKGVLCCS
jgi:hypothetical protein